MSISGIIGAAWHHAHSHLWRSRSARDGGFGPHMALPPPPAAAASPTSASKSQNDKVFTRPRFLASAREAGAATAGDLCDKSRQASLTGLITSHGIAHQLQDAATIMRRAFGC